MDFTADYLFDVVGNRMKKTVDAATDEAITYIYDPNDRLIHEFLDEDNNGSTDQTTIYQYGPGFVPLGLAGDWTVQTKKTVLDGLIIDPNTGTKLSETTSTYNPQGRLQQIDIDSDGDGDLESRSTYEYNDAGIRVSQTVETDTTGDGVRDDVTTTDYVIDNNNHTGYAQVLEEKISGAVVKSYTLGHDVIAQQAPADQSGSALFLLPDGHGSTRQLVDATGQPLVGEVYRYDAYGNPIGFDPSAALTTFLYSGEQTDRATGQQYLRARYYDMATGRFNRLDPFAGNLEDPLSLHKYLYGHGDPINNIDPTGLFSLGTVSGAISGLGSLAANISARAAIFAFNHSRLVGAAGFVLNLILPQDIHDAMIGSGIPPFQVAGSAGSATRGALRALVASKTPAFTRFMQKYSASQLGRLSRVSGQFFEDVLAPFMPGASRQAQTGIGRHTVDFVWDGWVIELKSGKSIDTKQLDAIAEFAQVEGKTFVYYFLQKPPSSVINKIRDAGGHVVSIFDK